MMGAMETPPGPPSEPTPEPPRRSSFEDYEIPMPQQASAQRPLRRPAVLTTAAVVLIVAAAINLLFVVGFRPSAGLAALGVVLGVAQAIGAVLILVRHPAGYAVGIALGVVGVVLGLTRAGADALSALMTIALSGFVIWAVASNRSSFRRG